MLDNKIHNIALCDRIISSFSDFGDGFAKQSFKLEHGQVKNTFHSIVQIIHALNKNAGSSILLPCRRYYFYELKRFNIVFDLLPC